MFKGDNQIKMCNKGSGDFRVRSHPAKFLACEQELRESLEVYV